MLNATPLLLIAAYSSQDEIFPEPLLEWAGEWWSQLEQVVELIHTAGVASSHPASPTIFSSTYK